MGAGGRGPSPSPHPAQPEARTAAPSGGASAEAAAAWGAGGASLRRGGGNLSSPVWGLLKQYNPMTRETRKLSPAQVRVRGSLCLIGSNGITCLLHNRTAWLYTIKTLDCSLFPTASSHDPPRPSHRACVRRAHEPGHAHTTHSHTPTHTSTHTLYFDRPSHTYALFSVSTHRVGGRVAGALPSALTDPIHPPASSPQGLACTVPSKSSSPATVPTYFRKEAKSELVGRL